MNVNTDNTDMQAGEEQSSSFEKDLQRLEEIVSQLEQGNLPLDRALGLYEEGVKAYKNCRETLQNAETRVMKLVENLKGELEEKPFEVPDNDENQD